MRKILVLCLALTAYGQTTDEKDVLAVAQRLFDGIAAHDAAVIRGTMMADARVYSARDEAAVAGLTGEELATRIAGAAGALRERFTGKPMVAVHGRIAQVWGEYDFTRDGVFSHCGVDVFTLFKTTEGWKVATVSYTAETKGCAPVR